MPEDLISYLMRLSNIVKLFHLHTSSGSLHRAADELYNAINESLDEIAECIQGYSDSKMKMIIKESETVDDIVPLIRRSRTYILEKKSVVEADAASLIDDLATKMSKFLYRASLK